MTGTFDFQLPPQTNSQQSQQQASKQSKLITNASKMRKIMSWNQEEIILAVLLCIFIFPFILVIHQLLKVGAEDEALEKKKLEQQAANKEGKES
jgi:hypothetical protein